MVDQSGMGDQRGTLLESPVQQLRRIRDCYSRIAAAGPCPQWHWYHSCFGATAAGAAELLPGVLSGSSAGCPCQMPTTAGGASGRPMEGDGKAARGKALATHVGCCVFWVVNRYVCQNAQTEICIPKCTMPIFLVGEHTIRKKNRGDRHSRYAHQNAQTERCVPKRMAKKMHSKMQYMNTKIVCTSN